MIEESESRSTPERSNAARRDEPEAKKGMTPETRIIVMVIGFALATFAFYVWAFTKDGVPSYGLWMVAGFIVLFTILTLNSLLPNAEEKLARRLAETGKPAVGVVTDMSRRGSLETSTRRYIYLRLTVDMEVDGSTRTVSLKAKIEEVLLQGFATGQRIHLLYDPQDPDSVAIDRAINPVSID